MFKTLCRFSRSKSDSDKITDRLQIPVHCYMLDNLLAVLSVSKFLFLLNMIILYQTREDQCQELFFGKWDKIREDILKALRMPTKFLSWGITIVFKLLVKGLLDLPAVDRWCRDKFVEYANRIL